jgi:uncharacterized protein (TIGR03086 family)
VSEISDRYRRLAAEFTETVAAVPTDRWSAQTPCDEWDARGLVGHVTDSQGLFLGMVGRSVPAGAPTVADDPLAVWKNARDAMQAALDDPDVAATEFDGMMGRSRLDAAVDRFIAFDLVVHRWDLARATGQDETISDDDLGRLRAGIAGFGDMLHSRRCARRRVGADQGARGARPRRGLGPVGELGCPRGPVDVAPAVDEQRVARDIGGVVAREEQRDRSDVALGVTHPTHRVGRVG